MKSQLKSLYNETEPQLCLVVLLCFSVVDDVRFVVRRLVDVLQPSRWLGRNSASTAVEYISSI